ncbi:MAG: hypothetical protein LBE09_07145 [Christensenellaceae bacterium]|jgi:uncharacterized membrane protein YvbJ|nr:hypothetical protein [Christensenellaceae bacterium]
MYCSKCGKHFDKSLYRVCPQCKAPINNNDQVTPNNGQPTIIILNQPIDNVVYKTGHSILLHIIFGGIVFWIPTIVFLCNPKEHYWHL